MLHSEEFWKKLVQNPKALGPKEREYWMEIEPILSELLDEIKEKGKTEISFIQIKEKHLCDIMNNLIQTNKNRNILDSLFDNKEKFLKGNSKFGFDEQTLTSLYVQIEAYSCVLSTECFKLLLLFHLRDVNPLVSRFSTTIEKLAPNAWKKLKPYVDNEFRNSLAHGTWAIERALKSKKPVTAVVLFRDAELEPYKRLRLHDFMIEIKKQNILCTCLSHLIRQKRKENFFT